MSDDLKKRLQYCSAYGTTARERIAATLGLSRIAELEAQLKVSMEALANLPEYLDGLECDLIALDLDFKLKDIVQPGIWADRVRAALDPRPTATGETP